MSKLTGIFIIFTIFFNLSQQSLPSRRIGSGSRGSIETFPWQAFVETGDGACSGFLIDPLWIITAGHCVENLKRAEDVRIILGSDNLNNYPYLYLQIKDFFLHPSYMKTFHGNSVNDIALLKLQFAVTLNKIVNTVSLFSGPLPNPNPYPAYVSGFGREISTKLFENLKFI